MELEKSDFPFEKPENWTNYLKWWLSHTRQQATQDHDCWEKGDRTEALGWSQLVVRRQVPGQSTGGRTQSEPCGLAELERTEAVVQGGKGDYNLWDKIPARGELHREISGNPQSDSLVIGQGLICVKCERRRSPGRAPLTAKELAEIPRPPTGLGKTLCSHWLQ